MKRRVKVVSWVFLAGFIGVASGCASSMEETAAERAEAEQAEQQRQEREREQGRRAADDMLE